MYISIASVQLSHYSQEELCPYSIDENVLLETLAS